MCCRLSLVLWCVCWLPASDHAAPTNETPRDDEFLDLYQRLPLVTSTYVTVRDCFTIFDVAPNQL